MANVYCDFTSGDDTTGDGTAGNPYKTIDQASIGLGAGDEVRCAKASDPTTLSGTLTFTNNTNTITTTSDLQGEISAGDMIGKGTDEYWYKVDSVTSDTITLTRTYYAGTTESGVTGYLLNWIDCGSPAVNSTPVQTVSYTAIGSTDNRMKVSGGWDLTSETQTGWTNYESQNGQGLGLRVGDVTGTYFYQDISKFRFLNFFEGMYTQGRSIKFSDITLLECPVRGWRMIAYQVLCTYDNITAVGCQTGMYMPASVSSCLFTNCVFVSCWTAGDGLYWATGSQHHLTFRDCIFSYNEGSAYGFNISTVTSVTKHSFINCSFDYNHYGTVGSTTYSCFAGCTFNNNRYTGCQMSGNSNHFVGCEMNDNVFNGVYNSSEYTLYTDVVASRNQNAGMYFVVDDTACNTHMRNVTCEDNSVEDIWFYNNVRTQRSNEFPCCWYPQYMQEDAHYKWVNENVVVSEGGKYRCDFHSIYGSGQYDTDLSEYLPDFSMGNYGLTWKYTGVEARGGSGSCMAIRPFSRPYNYSVGPTDMQDVANPPIAASFPFTITALPSEGTKRLTVYMKKSADWVNNKCRIMCSAGGTMSESSNITLTTSYEPYNIDIANTNLEVGANYIFNINLLPSMADDQAGTVYIDDFSVSDV